MTTPGKNYPGETGFPTPDAPSETSACRTFRIPDDPAYTELLMGAVQMLQYEWNWYQWGSLFPDEAADVWKNIINQTYLDVYNSSCPAPIQTPFWDTETDVDDEAEPEVQSWYGYVSDLDHPTTTFVEDVAVWSFAGFLALAGTPAAAIAFLTVAPKFIVAIRRGDLGEIIRLYIDGSENAVIDTSAFSPGEIIQQPVVTTGGGSHSLLLVKAS